MRTATKPCHAVCSTLERTNRDEVVQALNDFTLAFHGDLRCSQSFSRRYE
jgi:hypothetical protein